MIFSVALLVLKINKNGWKTKKKRCFVYIPIPHLELPENINVNFHVNVHEKPI